MFGQISWDDISHSAAFLLGFLTGVIVMHRLIHIVGRTLLHLINGSKAEAEDDGPLQR